MIDVVHAGKRLVAVGDRGHILYSDDQGTTWTQAKVPTRQLLTAVYFVDDQHGWAVGHDAQVLASTDGGATWSQQYQDLKREAPLLDVWFKDASHGLAVGAYGALIETTDGGKTWNDVSDRLDNEDQFHLNAIASIKDAGLFIVGEQGSMFRSSDDGQTWEKLEGPYEGSLFGVISTAQPQTLLAYGLRGNLYRSTDFGSTWEQVELNAARGALEFGLSGATLLDDGSLVVVGNGGSVVVSHDDGQTFSVFNRPDRISLSAVTAVKFTVPKFDSASTFPFPLLGASAITSAEPSCAVFRVWSVFWVQPWVESVSVRVNAPPPLATTEALIASPGCTGLL